MLNFNNFLQQKAFTDINVEENQKNNQKKQKHELTVKFTHFVIIQKLLLKRICFILVTDFYREKGNE